MSKRFPISTRVSEQLPEHIRIDNPSLVAFLEAYYEWLEQESDGIRSPLDLDNALEIDRSIDAFTDKFKKQYLRGFPETLALDRDTSRPVNIKTLIKNIKQFYRAKGTESSVEFLFRILFDTGVEFYYPKDDILRVSDGKWVEDKSLRLTTSLGNRIFEAQGKRIIQRQSSTNQTITASAVCRQATTYQIRNFEVAEVFLESVNGTFEAGKPIEIVLSDGSTLKELSVYSVVASVTVNAPGSGYAVGDVISISSAGVGVGAEARVSRVDANGAILNAEIANFGANYTGSPTVSGISTKQGSGASISVNTGALCEYPGYYANSDGHLSSRKRLQDNKFYQDYSYVMLSEITVDRYRDAIKELVHPAGMAFFGQILIKRCNKADMKSSASLLTFDVPYVGNYSAYTFDTFEDLSQWFTNNGIKKGFQASYHGTILGQSPNPATVGIPYTTDDEEEFIKSEGFSANSDPFWIIFQHPNVALTGQTVPITFSGVEDLVIANWSEYINTGGGEGFTNLDELLGRLGNFEQETAAVRTGQLLYTRFSSFQKIQIGAFLKQNQRTFGCSG